MSVLHRPAQGGVELLLEGEVSVLFKVLEDLEMARTASRDESFAAGEELLVEEGEKLMV